MAKGTKILTIDGRNLGSIADIFFDERSGSIEGYEVTGGVFSDAYTGRSFVPAPDTIKIGFDTAFVPPESASAMEEQVGGIRGAMQTAGARIQEGTDSAGQRFQEFSQSAGERLRSVGESASERADEWRAGALAAATNRAIDPAEQKEYVISKTPEGDGMDADGVVIAPSGQNVTAEIAERAESAGVLDRLYRATGGSLTAGINQGVSGALAGRTVEQAKGRRVQRSVRGRNGVIVAAEGQIVTDSTIEQAKAERVESAMMDATGLTVRDAARSSAGTAWSSADDRVRQGTEQFTERTRGFWDRLRGDWNDWQERRSQEAKEGRIRRALGRPVTRVILDQQDDVILNVGELIAHQAIEQARSAGVLDILVTSVYHREPPLSMDDLRAPEQGEARLEVLQRRAA